MKVRHLIQTPIKKLLIVLLAHLGVYDLYARMQVWNARAEIKLGLPVRYKWSWLLYVLFTCIEIYFKLQNGFLISREENTGRCYFTFLQCHECPVKKKKLCSQSYKKENVCILEKKAKLPNIVWQNLQVTNQLVKEELTIFKFTEKFKVRDRVITIVYRNM